MLSEVDHLVEKIELLPSGAWKPVEVEHDAAGSMNSPALSDDIQVVQENLATRNQRVSHGKVDLVSPRTLFRKSR